MTCRLSAKSSGFWSYNRFLPYLLGVVLIAVGSAQGQIATAAINGTVTDPSGAVIPGAAVSLKNTATNVERTTATNSAGNYVLVNVNPGRYTLTVHKDGFTAETEPEFELEVNQTSTLNFNLRVGSSVETITVEAAETGLQTSTSELGTVIDKRAVNDLPLNGRNFTQLLNLTPGVSTVNVAQNNSSTGQFDGNPVGSFSFPSINGQTNRSNIFLLDGLNDQESFGSTYSVPPIVDDIQEFKVDSHNDQAQFGGVLGGVVNVVTKSGTNSFHGEAWEFLRNSAFDAADPLNGESSLHQHEFGANIGGPVLLPHYNGRNRTFFFGSFEQAIIHTGNTNQNLIPTTSQLGGDFSAQGVPLYNPYSTTASGTRTPFLCVGGAPAPLIAGTKLQAPAGTTAPPAGTTACSILPSGLIDPNMQAVTKLLYGGLTPNLAGNPSANFREVLLNVQDPRSYNIRVDEELGPTNSFWGRFSHNSAPRNVPGIFGQVNLNDYHAHQVAITWNHVFGPSAILTLQFGRNYGFSGNPTLLPDSVAQALIKAGGYDPSFECSFKSGPRSCYFNAVNFSNGGIASFQEGTQPATVADIYQWKGDFTKTYGKHTFRMGADFNSNGFEQAFNTGHLDFSNQQTSITASGSCPTSAKCNTGGFAFASLLLGVPTGLTYRNQLETEHGGWIDGFYFQDQWRVTDRLTLNLGARYDVTFIPIYGSKADGNAPIGNFDANTGNYVLQFMPPDCATTNNQLPCILGGTLPAHVTVSPDGRFYHNNYDNIQPRVGVAFRLTNRTVLRGSYGRFFDNWAAILQMAQNQQGGWPIQTQISLTNGFNQGAAPPGTFAENPLQGANAPLPTPFGSVYDSNWYVDPNLKNPYSDQWNFGVQQALNENTTVTVNYVGSNGHRLDVGTTGNQATIPGPGLVPSTTCYGGPGSSNSSCSPDKVAAQGRFPFPYQLPTHYDVSKGVSWYDALQVSLDKKAGHGLSYLLAYTWSKAIDIGADEWFGTGTNGTSVQNSYNLNADKGLAGFDLPQIFTASAVYELPFGPGKKFESGVRPLDAIIGGWQVNGIANFNSGTLYNVTAANTIPNTGDQTGERANLVGDPHISNPSLSEWFNVAAFALPTCTAAQVATNPNSCYGSFSRNVLRGDGRANFDFSLFRSFPITEGTRLEFRAEAFNLTNSPVWNTPNANISTNLKCLTTGPVQAPCPSGSIDPVNNTFGVVTSTALGYKPRQLQLALKLYF